MGRLAWRCRVVRGFSLTDNSYRCFPLTPDPSPARGRGEVGARGFGWLVGLGRAFGSLGRRVDQRKIDVAWNIGQARCAHAGDQDVGKLGRELVVDRRQSAAELADRTESGQGLPCVVGVSRKLFFDERFEDLALAGIERATLDQQIGQRAVFVAAPGTQCVEEGLAVDEVHLHRNDAEQQIAHGTHERAPVGWQTGPQDRPSIGPNAASVLTEGAIVSLPWPAMYQDAPQNRLAETKRDRLAPRVSNRRECPVTGRVAPAPGGSCCRFGAGR